MLVIEGADGAGKTTLCNELLKLLPTGTAMAHFGRLPETWQSPDDYLSRIRPWTVTDRFAISEVVYGELRDGPIISHEDGKDIQQALRNANAYTVSLVTDDAEHSRRLAKLEAANNHGWSEDELFRVHEKYRCNAEFRRIEVDLTIDIPFTRDDVERIAQRYIELQTLQCRADTELRFITKLRFMFSIAREAAKLSTCKRKKVGCVVMTSDFRQVVSIGYNGVPAGIPNDECNELAGSCGCCHAEANAIAKLDPSRYADRSLVMATTMSPCETCAGMIINCNAIGTVYYGSIYRQSTGLKKLHRVGVITKHMESWL